MTKELLKGYIGLVFEEKQLEEQLEFWEAKAYAAGVSNLDGMPKSIRISDPTAAYIFKLQEIKDRLELKKIEVAEQMNKIEKAIDCLKPFYRYIMREYYINNKKWEQIAIDTNYSIHHIWRLHGKALKEVERL